MSDPNEATTIVKPSEPINYEPSNDSDDADGDIVEEDDTDAEQ